MKKYQILIAFTWILGLIVLILTIGEFLALHDISQDYVSKDVIKSLGTSLNLRLPDWSETRLEWTLVQISLLSRLVFLVLIAFTLPIYLMYIKRSNPQKLGK
jgi:hypothetical protein